jgi:copper transport protein
VALVVGALTAAAATPASAHAQLKSTTPDQSSVLPASPGRVVLHFDEAVESDFGSIRVYGPDGRRADDGGTHHPPGQPAAVEVGLPSQLADGTYTVVWRVVSDDSHPVQGTFSFSVGAASPRPPALTGGTGGDRAVGVVAGLVRFGLLAGLLVLVGAALAVGVLDAGLWRVRRVRVILWSSWAVVLVASVTGIAVQGVVASGLGLARAVEPSLFDDVLHTRFGEVQLLRIVLLIVAIPALVALTNTRRRPARPWPVVASLLGAALLVTPGLSGHASTQGSAAAGIPLDLAHMASAALWVGGIVVLAALSIRTPSAGERPVEVASLARRFSPLAVGAVIAVVATGVVQSLRLVGSWYALTSTTFGRTLVVKVLLVAVLVVLGAVSRHLARSSAEGPTAALRRSLLAEVAVVVAVVVATTLLIDSAPARQAAALPVTRSFEVLGDQVNVVVQPARVGSDNRVHFYVLGPTGEPRAVQALDATIGLPSAGIAPIPLPLVVAGPGHYLAGHVTFPVAGAWVLRATVRTAAGAQQQVRATVPVH